MRARTFSREPHSKVTRVPAATEFEFTGNIPGNMRNNIR